MKVFHISLLYFPIGGNGAIYHGKTIIHEIETNEKLSVHIKNQETGEVFDATNILPEYFYISIPLFNDRLEKEIDVISCLSLVMTVFINYLFCYG